MLPHVCDEENLDVATYLQRAEEARLLARLQIKNQQRTDSPYYNLQRRYVESQPGDHAWLDLLEIRVKELSDAVDYYLVVESTYTCSGVEKPLHLRSNLSAGFLREHAHKIVPISVDFYNNDGGDPWGPENYLRTTVWYEGHRRLKNISDDDLFIMSDADEIPSRDVVLFLKHHDGYGEPILLSLRWFVYGFFWENRVPVKVSGVCTVAFMREVYGNDSLRLRTMKTFTRNNMSNTGTFSEKWIIQGTSPHYAGWHCTWCFDAEGIQVKLAAAQRDDGVRWGDIAEKTDIGYINSLRKTGYFFDDSGPLERCDAYDAAPGYVRENAERFRWLMRP
ncbi:beta-1,4-mannosyl-glycoprotein 4-beta-N-acetylglucosaminyltransferase-like [Dermacentor albipictus]|uniref:beta-1,4-mannosyl-glycoprotein 4-beta-N-acetylglucosaminyltransferase-like n=1 Tax=Dermacentor albipictus TaxID=60249 RepID=UPI0038FCF01B